MTIDELRTYAKENRIHEKRIAALIAELHPDRNGELSLEESIQAIQAVRYAADTMDNIRTMLKKRKRAMQGANYIRVPTNEQDAASEQAKCDYRTCYDLITALQEELSAQHHDAELGCLDYKVVKALAATYELQDYLANRIAQAVATGELEPDSEE